MKYMTRFFLYIEALLYILFMSIDMIDHGYYKLSNSLKFLSIFICVIFTILLNMKRKARSEYLSLSYLFLILSDYFLLISDSYELGVCTFLCVQMLYFCYLEQNIQVSLCKMIKNFLINLLFAISVIVALCLLGFEVDRTLVIAVIYFLRFFGNVVLAIDQNSKQRTRTNCLFALGLILYFLCDINVGIFNLEMYLNLSNQFFQSLYRFATIAMWLFYLPGIVLITLSNQTNEK